MSNEDLREMAKMMKDVYSEKDKEFVQHTIFRRIWRIILEIARNDKQSTISIEELVAQIKVLLYISSELRSKEIKDKLKDSYSWGSSDDDVSEAATRLRKAA
jgi:hypothetical protein